MFTKSSAFKVGFVSVMLLIATEVEGGTLYLADGSNLYTVDTVTLERTFVGPAPCDGLALSPDPSRLYCSMSGNGAYEGIGFLYSTDLGYRCACFLTVIEGDADRGLAYNASNSQLYGTDNLSFGMINPATGKFTELASPPEEPESLAADPINNLIYGMDRGENLIVYDIASDQWSTVGPTGVNDGGKGGLAFDPVFNILYFGERDGDLYRIDPLATPPTATLIGTILGDDSSIGLAYSFDSPVPDIKANGSDSEIEIRQWNRLSVTVELDAGEVAYDADFWVLVLTPFGWYHYDMAADDWVPGEVVTFQGALVDIPTTQVLNRRIPLGAYEFYFGVDFMMNGVRDAGFSDSIQVNVIP